MTHLQSEYASFQAQVEAQKQSDRSRQILSLSPAEDLQEMRELIGCGMDPESFMFGLQYALGTLQDCAQLENPLMMAAQAIAAVQGIMTAVLSEGKDGIKRDTGRDREMGADSESETKTHES